jgi:Holliday junction resolvase RusA-like endonuclease
MTSTSTVYSTATASGPVAITKIEIRAFGCEPVPKGSHRAIQRKDKEGNPVGFPVVIDEKKGRLKTFERVVADAIREALPVLAARQAAAPPRPKKGRAKNRRTFAALLEGACTVHAVFFLSRPAGHFNKRTGQLKPSAPRHPGAKRDLDKLLRAVLDVLTREGVIHDDGHVVRLVAEKRFAHDQGRVGVVLEVFPGHPHDSGHTSIRPGISIA